MSPSYAAVADICESSAIAKRSLTVGWLHHLEALVPPANVKRIERLRSKPKPSQKPYFGDRFRLSSVLPSDSNPMHDAERRPVTSPSASREHVGASSRGGTGGTFRPGYQDETIMSL